MSRADILAELQHHLDEVVQGLACTGVAGELTKNVKAQDNPQWLEHAELHLQAITEFVANLQGEVMRARALVRTLNPSFVDVLPEGAVVDLPRGAS